MGQQDLVTRLLLEDSRFNRGIDSAKRRIGALKKQTDTASKSVESLQKGLAGLGAGVTIAGITTSIREMGRLQTALKNVSGSTAQYADNMKYLNDLSTKYGLNFQGMIGSYTKFIAAAKASNLTLEQQRAIFESVNKAASALQLSKGDTEGAMLAITQMLSKGKIQAEELRGQLGERIPGAFGLMAKSMGVTETELNKLLETGKVGTQNLVGFADELGRAFGDVDTGSIEASINKVSNAFTQFTGGETAQDLGRKFAAGFADGIVVGLKNATTIISTVITTAVSIGIGKLNSKGNEFLIRAKLDDEALTRELTKTAKELSKQGIDVGYLNAATQAATLIDREKALLQILKDKKNEQSLSDMPEVYNDQIKQLEGVIGRLGQIDKMKTWQTQYQGANMFNKALIKSKILAYQVGIALKSMLVANAPMIMLAVVGALVGKFVENYKAIKAIREETEKLTKVADGSIEYNKQKKELEGIKSVVLDTTKSLEQRQRAYKQLNPEIKDHKTVTVDILNNESKINEVLAKRLSVIQAEAKLRASVAAQIAAETKLEDNKAKIAELKTKHEAKTAKYKGKGSLFQGADWSTGYSREAEELEKQNEQLVKLLSGFDKGQKELLRQLESTLGESTLGESTLGVSGGNTGDKLEGLPKVIADYKEEVKKLNNAYANNGDLKAYIDGMQALNAKTKEVAETFPKTEKGLKDFLQLLSLAPVDLTLMAQVANDVKLEQFAGNLADASKALEDLQTKLKLGIVTEVEFKDEAVNVTRTLLDQAIAAGMGADKIAELTKAYKGALETQKQLTQEAADYQKHLETLKKGDTSRDKTFDYKLKPNEVKIADLEHAKDLLQEELSNLTDETEIKLKVAEIESNDVAINGLKVDMDIKGLKSDIWQESYNGVKNLSSAIGSLKNAFEGLDEAEGFEAVIGWTSALFSTIDAVMGAIDTFKNLSNMITMLGAATTTLTGIQTVSSGTTTAMTVAETTAKLALAKANENVAVTGAAAALASLPIVGPALSTAAATQMSVLLKGLQAFETGGIVGGNSMQGDNVLARVNSGEMILNRGQQANLFNAIDSGRMGGGANIGGSVEFKIKGKDLVGTLGNYSAVKSKTR